MALICRQIIRTQGVQLAGCQHRAMGVSAAAPWAHFPESWVIDEVWGQRLDEEKTREPAGQGGRPEARSGRSALQPPPEPPARGLPDLTPDPPTATSQLCPFIPNRAQVGKHFPVAPLFSFLD